MSYPKVKVELLVDLQNGEYDINFKNVSNPGEDIDLRRLQAVANRVLEQVVNKVEHNSEEKVDNISSEDLN